MKLFLNRKYKKERYTIGLLYADGKFVCNTIEDKVRDLKKEQKVKGQTAIPSGTYQIVITYSPHFKCDMPLLCNVPQFEGIRIHSGVDENSTEGCLVVGDNTVVGKLTNSKNRYYEVKKLIADALRRGEKVTIEIR